MTEAALAPKAPEERRRRIIDATVAVIKERGFAATRVSDIASRAGTSQGLVLYHFGSLANALAEAVTQIEDDFLADVERGLEDAEGPIERLRVIGNLAAGQGPAVGDWRLWLELWVHALRDPATLEASRALDRRWRAHLSDVIAEGVRDGIFHPTDSESAVYRLASLMDGMAVQLALENPEFTPERYCDLWVGAAALELGLDYSQIAR